MPIVEDDPYGFLWYGERPVPPLRALDADWVLYLPRLWREYGARRAALLGALARHLPAGTRWGSPSAGMFVWVELPRGIDTVDLLRAAVEREQVVFVPGAAFTLDGRGARNALRLNFTNCAPEMLQEAVERLGRVVRGEFG